MSLSRKLRRNATDTTPRRVRFLVTSGALTEQQGTHVLAATARGLSMQDALLSLGTPDIGDAAVFDATMRRLEREKPGLAAKIDEMARALMGGGHPDPAE